MRANRVLSVGLVLLIVSTSWLSMGLLGSSPVRFQPGYYLNVNQEVVPPGGSVSVYASYPSGSPTVQLVRLDAVAFSANQTLAIQEGVVVDQRSLVAPTTSPSFSKSTDTSFSNLTAGLYAVTLVVDGNVVAWDPLQVSKIGLVQRSGATKALIWSVRLDSGAPVAGVNLYRDGKLLSKTDAEGIAWVAQSQDGKIVASHADGPALLGGNRYWYGQQSAQRVALYTDRPLYRPGQTVHLKLIAWANDGDHMRPQPNASLEYTVENYHNGRSNTIDKATLRANAYGSAVRDLVLPVDAAVGHYTIRARWHEQDFYGSFQVEEYRLPKFKVDVTPNDKRVAVGDPLDLLVTARYYYGEPLTDGKVHYEITGSGWGWLPCDWCSYEYAGNPESYQRSGDLELGTDGTARLQWTPDTPGHFQILAQVTAITGERIDASARVTVAPADRLIGMSLSDWVVKPNTTTTLRIRLSDLTETAVDDNVRISMLRGDWVYRDGQWVEDRAAHQNWTLRTQDGRAELPFRVPTSGSYRFEAHAQDSKGRTTTSTLWFWASDESWSWWHGSQLELIPERTQYQVGETIRINVGASKPLYSLVTLEGQDVFDVRVLRPDQRSAAFTAAARHTPNVHATVLQVDPSASSAGYSYPSLPSDQVRIQVGPHANALRVEVETDREAYSDGEAARILVRVFGADGRPVQAEVSLAMVDEALLSLGQDPFQGVLATFYPERYPLYPTASWYYQSWDNDGRTFLAASGASGTAGMTTGTMADSALERTDKSMAPPDSINVREYFPETALWLGQLETDADGVLRLHALLPDSLTTWRITVHAISKAGQAGDNQTDLITRRNVVADVFAPRFLVDGDESTVQATVANYIGAFTDFHTLFNVTGAEIVGDDGRTLTLSHGQSDLVSFRIRATQPGAAIVTFYAWNGAEQGDAIRIRIPVHPHGIESRETRAGRGTASVSIVIPPSAAQSPSRLNVTLSPTIADVLVEALPYLTGFPYGCVEQTLSRFLPTLAVAQAAKEMGLNKSTIDPKIDEQVDTGIQRLYGFQHEDGGWGWWTADGRNPYTTTYVVYGLSVARDLGYHVDPAILQRGVDALRKMVDEQKDAAPALHAYAVYALAVAEKKSSETIPTGSGAAELALAAIIAQRTGRTDVAKQKTGQLAALAVTEAGRSHWQENEAKWGGYGITSDTMLTALALRALVETNTQESHMHGAARWLLENRIGTHWYTTKDTAEAILSLAAYFKRDVQSNSTFQVTLTIDGASESYTMDPKRLFNGSRSVERIVGPGTHAVNIQTNNDRLYWSVAGVYWDGEEPVRAKQSEFRVQRTMRDDKGQVVHRLRVGQEATVQVDVTAVGEARRYVQVESPLPSGLETVTNQGEYNQPWWYNNVVYGGATGGVSCHWCYYWSAAEVHDDRVGFFAWQMEPGQTYTFAYRVRAVFPGDYHVMPAAAEEMYDPDVRGHGDEDRVVVEAPASVQFGRVSHDVDRVQANLYPVGAADKVATVYVKQGQDEFSRGRFDRGVKDHWSVALAAPAVGDYWLYVEAGSGPVKKLIKRTPEVQVFPDRFNETLEEAWDAGTVLEVRSALAKPASKPQFASIFGEQEPDGFDTPSKRRSGIEGFTLMPLLVAAMVLVIGMRRRRPQ
jgi:alpha-2-macroglobulin